MQQNLKLSRMSFPEDRVKLNELDSDALISMLGQPDEKNRAWVIIELSNRKETRAVDALIKLLLNYEKDSNLASYAAGALGKIGDRRAVEPLIAVMNEQFIGGQVVEALVELGDDQALEPIIRLFERTLHDPSLATVLGNWGDRRAVEPLIRAMSQPNSHVRFYAARALGKLGDERTLPVLERARDNDTTPITDAKSLRGKSVSDVAAKAIEKIKAAHQTQPKPLKN